MRLINKIRSSRNLYNIGYWSIIVIAGVVSFLLGLNSVVGYVVLIVSVIVSLIGYIYIFFRPMSWPEEDKRKEGLNDL